MKLIDEASKFYKLYSVQAMAIAAAILSAWQALPQDMQADMPHWVITAVHWSAIVTLVGGIGLRLVDQQPKDPDATDTGPK